MARQAMTEGKCYYCEKILKKSGMKRHLESCKNRKALLEKKKGKKCYHILVDGYKIYWIHIEIPVDMTLGDLDRFLRDIWLECCGHLSLFRIGGQHYSSYPEPSMGDKSMKFKLSKVIGPGDQFVHEYDFGTTTGLTLKVLSQYEGETKGKRITLMARNEPPDLKCAECGKKAAEICCECVWDGEGLLCEKCAENHDCGEEMLLPVVNSPRTGMCGYTG